MPLPRTRAITRESNGLLAGLPSLPAELIQMIFDYVLLFSQTDKSLAFRLMCTSKYLANTISPALYRHVSLNARNASTFFYGLDGKLKRGENRRWRSGNLEGKSSAVRRAMWLSMVRRVEIQDLKGLEACVDASAIICKHDEESRRKALKSHREGFLFFGDCHPANKDEEAVLLLGSSLCEQLKSTSHFDRQAHSHLVHQHILYIDLPPKHYPGSVRHFLFPTDRYRNSFVLLNYTAYEQAWFLDWLVDTTATIAGKYFRLALHKLEQNPEGIALGVAYTLARSCTKRNFAILIENYTFKEGETSGSIEERMMTHFDEHRGWKGAARDLGITFKVS
ncbi:hypothetical protein L198_04828 [Cryptococcus wingfieldii CBS 7118]|uniref:F-box domain-containing protein n=1 Tax=Cryptococcus wingfieldii CBS 7118 TaxID=1295528 RepID=A0A1E3J1E2_9TREE|nr:hypothetical protein L198_04828 [Cryptococcus wingfieldii CBS 7118]ODN94687.1 hypothetical protein L198_04828 [Cryptococcus wingfieldii CBS 7118]